MLAAAIMAIALPIPQYRCDAPTYASWATAYSGDTDTIVPASLVFSVRSNQRDKAMAMLARRSFARLDAAQLKAMIGFAATTENFRNPPSSTASPDRDPTDRVARKPYLVRAVFPGKAPVISLGWMKDILVVSTVTLGCAPFFNEPLIVWLDRAPTSVAVIAGADL